MTDVGTDVTGAGETDLRVQVCAIHGRAADSLARIQRGRARRRSSLPPGLYAHGDRATPSESHSCRSARHFIHLLAALHRRPAKFPPRPLRRFGTESRRSLDAGPKRSIQEVTSRPRVGCEEILVAWKMASSPALRPGRSGAFPLRGSGVFPGFCAASRSPLRPVPAILSGAPFSRQRRVSIIRDLARALRYPSDQDSRDAFALEPLLAASVV